MIFLQVTLEAFEETILPCIYNTPAFPFASKWDILLYEHKNKIFWKEQKINFSGKNKT